MPRGYRRYVAAIVGWIILGGSQPPPKQAQRASYSQQTTPTAETARTPAPALTTEQGGQFAPYPYYDPDPCYRSKNKDAADLCAQWRSAIAAEKAAHEARRANLFSIIAAFLSVATVVGLIITILQTSGALREARRGNRLNLLFERRSRRESRKSDEEQARALKIAGVTAQAAIDNVQTARDAMIMEQRAWLYPSIKSFQSIRFQENGVQLNFTYGITNNGRTHGTIISNHAELVGQNLRDITDRADKIANTMQKVVDSRFIFPGEIIPDFPTISSIKREDMFSYNPSEPISITILIFIFYKTAMDESIKYTIRAYDVFKANENGSLNFIKRGEGLSADLIRYAHGHFGNLAT